MITQAFAGAVTMLSAKALEAEIVRQVMMRGAGKTICPSEVARAVAEDWRAVMPAVRTAAGRLAAQGLIDVTQKGQVVDIASARGPVRLGLP